MSASIIGEGNGTPLQYSCLETPMDGGAWWAAVYGVAKSRTWLSESTTTTTTLLASSSLTPDEFSSVLSLSRVRLFETPWTAAHYSSVSITNSQSLQKLMSIESVMPSNHLILCHPLLFPPSIFSSIRVMLSNESVLCIRWPKYCSFSISPSSEYSEFISFRIGGFVLLAVQGILKAHL